MVKRIMKEPIELVKRGTDSIVAFACGECGTVVATVSEAREHCVCRTCGKNSVKPPSVICRACSVEERERQLKQERDREAALLLKAKKVSSTEYQGAWAYDPSERLGRDGFGRLVELLEEIDDFPEDERPNYLWGCAESKPFIDPSDAVEAMIDRACSDQHEDAIDQIVGEEELREAITPAIMKWNAAQTTTTAEIDYSVAIVLREPGSG